MNFKQFVVAVNDVVVYAAFALVAVFALGMFLNGDVLYANIVLLGGWLICSLFSGFWIALSNISSNSDKALEVQKQHLDILHKIYKIQLDKQTELTYNFDESIKEAGKW